MIVTGGLNRGALYRFAPDGGEVPNPFARAAAAPAEADPAAHQFRLQRLQTFNWGTFSGLFDFAIPDEGYLFVGLVYFACCFAMSRYSHWLERRLGRWTRR